MTRTSVRLNLGKYSVLGGGGGELGLIMSLGLEGVVLLVWDELCECASESN